MFPIVVVSEITRVLAFQIQDKKPPLDRKPLDGGGEEVGGGEEDDGGGQGRQGGLPLESWCWGGVHCRWKLSCKNICLASLTFFFKLLQKYFICPSLCLQTCWEALECRNSIKTWNMNHSFQKPAFPVFFSISKLYFSHFPTLLYKRLIPHVRSPIVDPFLWELTNKSFTWTGKISWWK